MKSFEIVPLVTSMQNVMKTHFIDAKYMKIYIFTCFNTQGNLYKVFQSKTGSFSLTNYLIQKKLYHIFVKVILLNFFHKIGLISQNGTE